MSLWRIFSNPSRRFQEVGVGPHPDAAKEICFQAVGDRGVADILDTGKRGLDEHGLDALVGLGLREEPPVSDKAVKQLRAISRSVGLDPDYMAPEVIDTTHKGDPGFTLEDVGDGPDWQYYKAEVFGPTDEARRARQHEHVRAITKHVAADRNASWRDDSTGGF